MHKLGFDEYSGRNLDPESDLEFGLESLFGLGGDEKMARGWRRTRWEELKSRDSPQVMEEALIKVRRKAEVVFN